MAEVLNPVEFSRGVAVKYPYFKVSNPDESFQLVCRNLDAGEVPLCLEYKGSVFNIQNISMSAYNVQKLLNSLEVYFVTESGQHKINTINDYLEGALAWTC